MATKKKGADGARTAVADPETPISERDDATGPHGEQGGATYKDNPDKPDPTSIAQVQVLPGEESDES